MNAYHIQHFVMDQERKPKKGLKKIKKRAPPFSKAG